MTCIACGRRAATQIPYALCLDHAEEFYRGLLAAAQIRHWPLPPSISQYSPPSMMTLEEEMTATGLNGLELVEREVMLEALADHQWNQQRAARSLGVSRRMFNYKVRHVHQIDHPHMKRGHRRAK